MIRKLLVGGAAALVLGGLVVGTGINSYLRTGVSWVSQSVKDAVPVEVEMRRARQMISDLEPEIGRNMQLIAKEKYHVSRLEKQVEDLQANLSGAERDIMRLTSDLKGGDNVFVYAGRTYDRGEVREDLTTRFRRFKTQQATQEKLAHMLDARRRSLEAARERVDAMLSAKRQLEVEVENLQARLAAVEVAQTSSHLVVDDSHLSRTRELLDEIASRIDVQEEMLAVDAEYHGAIQLDEPEEADILEEVAQYFGENKQPVERLVKTGT